MSLEDVREHLTSLGYGCYLEALPTPNSLIWKQYRTEPALVIGKKDESDVIAYLTQYRDRKREPRYCLSTNSDTGDGELLWTQDAVLKMPLFAPFNNIAVCVPSVMKRKLAILVRFYFLWKGHLPQHDGDLTKFCTELGRVLKGIYWEGEDMVPEDGEADMFEESPEPNDPARAFGLRSASRDGAKSVGNGEDIEQPKFTTNTPHRKGKEANPYLVRLLNYLSERKSLYLLDNIPDVEAMQFTDQTQMADARPKKLFVGSHAESGCDIYAYMIQTEQRSEVRFYAEGIGFRSAIRCEDVGHQRILHPFSKTCPKATTVPLTTADRARLTLIVKYYFIVAGIATDCVLKEAKTFPERLRTVLGYIAERMGPAAVKPPPQSAISRSPKDIVNVDDDTDESDKQDNSEERDHVNKSKTRPTLASEKSPRIAATSKKPEAKKMDPRRTIFARKSAPSIPQRPTPIESTPTPTLPRPISPATEATVIPDATPTPALPPHTPTTTITDPTSKRPHEDEDAAFEELRRLMVKNDELTKDINAVTHELETHEMRKEAFLAKWTAEHEALVEKQAKIRKDKADVRRQVFKRQKMSDEEEG